MRKRLRYAMPRVPLLKHRQRNPENDNDVAPIVPKRDKTPVGQMAKRIVQEAKKKKERVDRPEPYEPLGGDLTSSDSDDSTLGEAWGGNVDNLSQDGAWGGDVDKDTVIVHQWEEKESSESDGGWHLQAGMPMTPR